MLIPKRVKYRKQFRGRMKGQAHRGNKVAHGEYGLVALEPSWITNRQIEGLDQDFPGQTGYGKTGWYSYGFR